MSGTLHAFDFLQAAAQPPAADVQVIFGDEPFLKRQVLARLRQAILGDGDIPYASFEGRGLSWRDVNDELATASLFGGGGTRLAVIEDADDFVTRYRHELESYIAKERHPGRLILLVTSWAANTRLYKQVDRVGLQVECRTPEKKGRSKAVDGARVEKWLIDWSRGEHDAVLQPTAAKQLLELVGTEFGLLDQALAKLALFAGRGGKITMPMVDEIVGGWRAQTIWELLDAATDGRSGEALTQLDRLLQAGENPLALFGQIAWSLRRFAAATRCFEHAERCGRRIGLNEALERAGFPKWSRVAMQNGQRQLKQLGRRRAGSLYRWLLEADLALKGTHSSPPRARFVLEQLLVRMSNQLAPGA